LDVPTGDIDVPVFTYCDKISVDIVWS